MVSGTIDTILGDLDHNAEFGKRESGQYGGNELSCWRCSLSTLIYLFTHCFPFIHSLIHLFTFIDTKFLYANDEQEVK